LNLEINATDSEKAQTIEIYNNMGQLVNKISANDSGKLNIDFSDLPSGIYRAICTEGMGENRRVFNVSKL